MPPFLLTLAGLLSFGAVFAVGLVHSFMVAPVPTFIAVVLMLAFVVYALVDLDKTFAEIDGRGK